ncbi:DJ-1/PfpI family protein [Saccharopolyspora sp. NPDC000359]|uniref:DJ-1/PfpI family protein n=1 Tax=Saccharopolyspora sp. NPDC000359 TaxID=3154251 RepID=UPI00331DF594
MHVQIVLFDGFDPLDAVAPFEVFHAGGMASDGAVTTELVSAEGPREVVSGTGGLSLRATAVLDPMRAGVVLVPGAAGPIGDTPGVDNTGDTIPALLGRTLETPLPALLGQALAQPDVLFAAVCGGSLIPAMAGLIESRHATTHHEGMDLLDATGVHAVRARVVDDGDLVTGAGVTSGLDLGLHLLEREVGPQVAHAVEELFAHERRGVVWRNTGPHPTGF